MHFKPGLFARVATISVVALIALAPFSAAAQSQFVPDSQKHGAMLPGQEGTVGAPVISRTDVGDGSTVVVLQDGTVSREWNDPPGVGFVMYPDGSVVHCALNSIAVTPHLTCD
jgi:hypothetical protein